MPHDLEILYDTIDVWFFQIRRYLTIVLKNFAINICLFDISQFEIFSFLYNEANKSKSVA